MIDYIYLYTIKPNKQDKWSRKLIQNCNLYGIKYVGVNYEDIKYITSYYHLKHINNIKNELINKFILINIFDDNLKYNKFLINNSIYLTLS